MADDTVSEQINKFGMDHLAKISSVQFQQNIAFQQILAPFREQDFLHPLPRRAVSDGEAEALVPLADVEQQRSVVGQSTIGVLGDDLKKMGYGRSNGLP
jgi:hypothetical protein